MKLARGLALSVALALATPSGVASAETAEELFAKAEKAMDKKDYDTACAAFATSFQLSDGKGALYRLAQCEDARGGRLATQIKNWRDVRGRFADKADIVAEADQRLVALDAQVARITIRRGAGAPPDLKVELDGHASPLDEAIAVDAGRHTVVGTAAGASPMHIETTLRDGEQRTIELAPSQVSARDERPPTEPSTDDEGGGLSFTTAGFIAGGVGIAGLTVFAISTPILAGASGDIDEACGEDRTCSPSEARTAETAKSDAEGWQIPNAVGLVVGVVGVGLGVTFLVIGATEDAPVAAAVGPGNVTVRGAF
jgi:hypothetical protein